MFFIKILIVVIILQLSYLFISNRFIDSFMKGFSCIMGLRGTGKSSFATIIAQRYIKKGIPVYSNFPIAGCYVYEPSDLGVYMVCDCALILDEAGIDVSNRKFMEKSYKGIREENRAWWKKSRHYGCNNIYVLSQSFDYDVTLRRLSTCQYIITRASFPFGGNWSKLIPLRYGWDISDDGTEAVVKLQMAKFFYLWFNRRPSYGLYDSWDREELPHKDFPYISYPSIFEGAKLPIWQKIINYIDRLYLDYFELIGGYENACYTPESYQTLW